MAFSTALGRACPAMPLRTSEASCGARAGPAARFCVAFARRADPDATVAGLPANGSAMA